MNQEDLNRKPQINKKPRIATEEWNTYNANIRLSTADLNKIVMNFFIVEGLMRKYAAINFMRETGTKVTQEEIESMTDRIEVKRLILDGQIDGAMEKLENMNPEILQNDLQTVFALRLQKLIEYIKTQQIEKAINFAQNELVPLVEKDNALIEQVEKAMTLLAFEDFSQCPVNHLVENQQRLKVSSEINTALLKQQHNAQDAKLGILIKLLLWSQKTLASQIEFPELIELSTGKFKIPTEENKIAPLTELD